MANFELRSSKYLTQKLLYLYFGNRNRFLVTTIYKLKDFCRLGLNNNNPLFLKYGLLPKICL